MAGQNYYLLCSLPPLGDLGSAEPLTLGEMLEHVGDASGPRTLVETLFLGDDLLQREGFLAGETKEVSPAVLTAGQARNEEPLPDCLAGKEQDEPPSIAADAVWSAYFRHAANVARTEASGFLTAWVGCEVAMRNALAAARAKALGLEPADYLVAEDISGRDEDFTSLLSEWSAAKDPLAGLRVLDEARSNWLKEHDGWFTFADDELAAYAAKLMLLHRWRRLTECAAPAAGAGPDRQRGTDK